MSLSLGQVMSSSNQYESSTSADASPHAEQGSQRKVANIDSLTTVRGLAALWVVLYHYQADIYLLFPDTLWLRPFFNLGNLAVPLFFILSGFVLSYNYSSDFRGLEFRHCGRFILIRLARIYPVHIFTLLTLLLMVFAAKAIGLHLDEGGYSVRDFVLNLFLIHTWVPNFRLNWNFPSWSISSEWFAYLWFPVIAYALNRMKSRSLVLLTAASFFALMQFQIVFENSLPFRELLAVVGTFLTGCAIFKLIEGNYSSQRPSYYLSIVSLMFVLLTPFLLSGRILLVALLTLFAIIVYSLGSLGGKCPRLWTAPILVFIGEVSYSLYMTHTLVQRIVEKVIPASQAAGRNVFLRLGLLVIYVIAIALATLATYWLIEKPFRSRLRSLASKSKMRLDSTGQNLHQVIAVERSEIAVNP